MPEFHLRRKKKVKENRRHTLQDSSEQGQQLQRALEMYQEHNEIILGPNEISVDDAVAGRRVNAVDDSVIKKTTSSCEPSIKANVVRKISSKYSECLYLRYSTDMRRCPMPSPITLTTIKQLFVNLFNLSPATISDPAWYLFILDRSNAWKPLEVVSVIYDHCTILLVDSTDIGTLIPSPVSVDTTRQSRCSTATPDNELLGLSPSPIDMRSLSWHESPPGDHNIRPKSFDFSLLPRLTGNNPIRSIRNSSSGFMPECLLFKSPLGIRIIGVHNSVQQLKHDLLLSRQQHKMKMNEMNIQFQIVKQTLLAAVKGNTISCQYNDQSSFRQERMALDSVKQDYILTSSKAHHDLNLLQAVIEELRVDAVNRRCKVDSNEIDTLLSELEERQATFRTLQDQYVPFEQKLKHVMREELTVIVNEESFVQEESTRLEEGLDTCTQLSTTLETLKQFSSLQNQRSPHVPVFSLVSEVDREALLLSISSITPNHSQRLDNITLAEQVQRRKQELSPSRRALKEFEKSLRNQQQKLKVTNNLETLEKQLEEKTKLLYKDEKIKRQQELERELQIKEEMKKKKKQKEMEVIKAKFKHEEDSLKQKEKEQMEELQKVKEEKEKLEIERKRNEEERKRLEEMRKQQHEEEQRRNDERQEEERKRLVEMRKQREEEQRRNDERQEEERKKEMERMKHTEENIRLSLKKEKEERKKMEKDRLQQVEEMLRKEIEKEKFEERRKFEEEQRLLDELLNNDSPSIKAKRKDLLWKQIQERARQEIEEEERKTEKTNQLRSQQTVMDNNYSSSMAASTPVITRRTDSPAKGSNYSNHFISHRSNPYLHQENGFNSEHLFQHMDLTSSFPSAPLHRRIVPSLSIDLKRKAEPSYDSLDKIFKSEENVTQNHYDLPWSSKKLSIGSVQRRGTVGSFSDNHRRNKSEGISDMLQHENLQQREILTPSPGYHHSYTPPLKKSPSMTTTHKPHSPVYDDVNHGSPSLIINGRSANSLLQKLPAKGTKQVTENGPYPAMNGNNLPSYSQIIGSSTNSPVTGHRQRSLTTNARLTHYPLTTNPQKQKPSVSYV